MKNISTKVLRVKGVRYYDASRAFALGELAPGTMVRLEPQPENKHDKNAVAVYSCKGKMLGHIGRDIAQKYQRLSIDNRITASVVSSADKTDDFSKYNLKISVSFIENITSSTRPRAIQGSDKSLPDKPGVYELSFGAARFYIGATSNLRKRKGTHLNKLKVNLHSNNVIQNDFNRFGIDALKYRVIKITSGFSEAEVFEEQEIRKRLENGELLYNKTIDGKGRTPQGIGGESTVSDIPPEERDKIAGPKGDFPSRGKAGRALDRPLEAPTKGIGSASLTEIIFEDGKVYRGDVLNKKAHGKGRIQFPNGDVYVGDFKMDQRTGRGVFYWADGRFYEGQFLENEITGAGKYTWPNGDVLAGTFLNGRRKTGKLVRKRY